MAGETASFINMIDVNPDRQQELIDVLTEGIEKVIRHRPGFLSITIFAGLDGSRVINYARWRSVNDVTATQADPDAATYARRAAAIAEAGPSVYRVVASIR